MRLTVPGAQMYLTTSHVSLAYGVLSWDEYLLRLRFLRDCTDPATVEGRAARDLLRDHEDEGADEWPAGEPDQAVSGQGPTESKVSISEGHPPFEPPVLALVAAEHTGLHQWEFHQADPDFFPSIPHGHWRSDRKKKFHAYRGWMYHEDRQIGREPRWKIVALWNDEKFRSFASAAIQYYLVTFPGYRWPVPYPLRLPRRR
ncbi:MAG: hypothetical protein GDA67_01180 [Nitrospira sp. CR1.3]|nr:hypothetical protein [Nitrospira sp. CR1.3]